MEAFTIKSDSPILQNVEKSETQSVLDYAKELSDVDSKSDILYAQLVIVTKNNLSETKTDVMNLKFVKSGFELPADLKEAITYSVNNAVEKLDEPITDMSTPEMIDAFNESVNAYKYGIQ